MKFVVAVWLLLLDDVLALRDYSVNLKQVTPDPTQGTIFPVGDLANVA